MCLKWFQNLSNNDKHITWNDPKMTLKWSQYDFKMVHKYLYHVPKIPLKASNEAFGRRPNKCLNEEAPNRARAQLFFYKYQWYKKIIQKIQKCAWNAKNTNNTKNFELSVVRNTKTASSFCIRPIIQKIHFFELIQKYKKYKKSLNYP